MTISILKAESFQPLGPAIKRASKPAPDPVQVRPGVFQGTDGRMFTDFATGQSVAPAPKASPPAPDAAAAPATALGDWIEWAGGSCPIPDADEGDYEIRWSDGSIDQSGPATDWRWFHEAGVINLTSYRLIPTEAA